MADEAVSSSRAAAHPRRRLVLAALEVLLVVVVLEVLLVRSYGATERTTRDFRDTTDAATGVANAQRETLLLTQEVEVLGDGDSLAPLQLRRELLERQLNVVEAAVPDGVALRGRLDAMRARLREFDRTFAETYGDGRRAHARRSPDAVREVLKELNLEFKESFDEAEHSLYSALAHALDKRAHGQLLVVRLSVLALLGATALGLVLWRVIRGDFARAYHMLARTEARLARLVGQLPAIVHALDLGDDGRSARTVYVSPQVERIVDYLRERVPGAFERAAEGISRVGAIVRAMREFAHPPTSEQAPVDLNDALRNTLIVAANEYEYVAEVETELGDLPQVTCNGGDINQVLLNLIVNAAHAIEEKVSTSGGRGRIRIRTWRERDHAAVSIANSGCGIPDDIADRVFDPFFTTKEVGRGTGQGLAIARTLVVERHAGTLSFDTEPGGTTFEIRLPIGGCARSRTPSGSRREPA